MTLTRNKQIVLFSLAVAVQLLLLAAVPAQKIIPRLTGKTITLKIVPRDPFSPLSGYYMALNYEVSRSGSQPEYYSSRDKVYAVLRPGPDGDWHLVSQSTSWPGDVPADGVVLAGWWEYGRIRYGIEAFYLPEDKRAAVEADARAHPEDVRADVAVDRFGNAALVRLRIQDRGYDY